MTKEEIQQEIKQAVERVRAKTPLVPSITNSVTINLVANAQLAAGGSAAMVYLPDEGYAMAEAGDAMYINMGTLQPVYEKIAAERHISFLPAASSCTGAVLSFIHCSHFSKFFLAEQGVLKNVLFFKKM